MKGGMRFLQQSVAIVAVGIFWVGIAHAEVLTRVEGVTPDTKLLKEFALGNTPCRIEEGTQHSSELSTYLANSGLNIVADKDAKCLILYDGYVTMYRTGTPDPLPLAEYDLLAHTPPYVVAARLSATNASADMDKAVNAMAHRDGWEAPTAGKYAAAAVGAVAALLPIGALVTAFSGAGTGRCVLYSSKEEHPARSRACRRGDKAEGLDRVLAHYNHQRLRRIYGHRVTGDFAARGSDAFGR